MERPESALEALAAEVEAVTDELGKMKLEREGAYEDLADALDELEDALEELEDIRARLDGKELELQKTQSALAASEAARRAANRERVLARPESKQEVFAVEIQESSASACWCLLLLSPAAEGCGAHIGPVYRQEP